VLCHNSNCVEPVDLSQDDTLPALEKSLALEFRGRPALDGVEVDILWRRDPGDCLFAHDLDDPAKLAPVDDLARVLVTHITESNELSWNGTLYTVFVELKPSVDPQGSAPTSAEGHSLATCAISLYQRLAASASAAEQNLEVVFSSFSPTLLRQLFEHSDWPGANRTPARLALVTGIPRPLDNQTRRLSALADGVPLSVLETHPDWLLSGQRDAYESLGLDLSFWMFSATAEILDAIERYEPRYVSTGEAQLLRRWLAR